MPLQIGEQRRPGSCTRSTAMAACRRLRRACGRPRPMFAASCHQERSGRVDRRRHAPCAGARRRDALEDRSPRPGPEMAVGTAIAGESMTTAIVNAGLREGTKPTNDALCSDCCMPCPSTSRRCRSCRRPCGPGSARRAVPRSTTCLHHRVSSRGNAGADGAAQDRLCVLARACRLVMTARTTAVQSARRHWRSSSWPQPSGGRDADLVANRHRASARSSVRRIPDYAGRSPRKSGRAARPNPNSLM